MATYDVFINGLEVYAYNGVPAEERVIGHRLTVDLALTVEGGATETDQVDDTVDYSAVASQVTEFLTSVTRQTLERLAQEIAYSLLEEHPRILTVEVTLSKPMPPMPFMAESVGVHISVTRP